MRGIGLIVFEPSRRSRHCTSLGVEICGDGRKVENTLIRKTMAEAGAALDLQDNECALRRPLPEVRGVAECGPRPLSGVAVC